MNYQLYSSMKYKRIISLVPSLTELLIDLGLDTLLVGRTKFCIHPKNKVQQIPSIGGTKNPAIDRILSLNPDLIIANREENRKEDIEELSQHCEVLVTEIDTVQQALEWITKIENKLEVVEVASKLVSEIKELVPKLNTFKELRTAYFIWKDPWMTIGNYTYIHDVMKQFGLKNVYGNQSRYPETDLVELSSLNPELILLSSEPYPFKGKHIQEIRKECPTSEVLLVDGEWFSWYGSRMIPAFEALSDWRIKIGFEA